MNLRKLLLLTSATYWVGAMPAHAGIETLIIGIHGFLLSSTAISATIAGTLATVIGYGIAGAAVLGLNMLAGPRGGAVKPSDAKSTFETGESSVIEGIGRVRVGGLKAFGNTDGSTRARLICRLQGPIDAIESYYLGQREVTVEANGDVSSPPWARPSGSWVNWQDKLGTGAETAWAGIMALFPSLWTAAHRVRGIAQSQLLFYNPGLSEKKYLSLYQSGVPDSEWVARASLIYDPRNGLTRWSDNGPLICAHVLRRDPAFTFDRFNWMKIAEAANKADVLVPTRTGDEKRCRLWGMWAWESERGQTMQQFLDSAGLEIRLDENGLIYFEFIDDVAVPEVAFTPDDILDYSWGAGPEAVERPNICRLKFYSPERNYEMADVNLDGIAWAHVQDEVGRYGPKYLDLELPFCPSVAQAQRIARRKFALARADGGVMITNMVGLAAWGRLYAQVTEPDLGDIEVVRLSPPRIDDSGGSVEIPFQIWPSMTAWNPATDEALPPDVVPELGYETDMITPAAPTKAVQIIYPSGSREMRIAFALPNQSYDVAEASYRVYTGDQPSAWRSMEEYPGKGDGGLGGIGGNNGYSVNGAYVLGDFTAQTIDARVRVFSGDDGTYFSPSLQAVVTVDNTVPASPIITTSSGAEGQSRTATTHDVQVSAITLQKYGGLVNPVWVTLSRQSVRPYQIVPITPTGEGSYRVFCETSGGTTSAFSAFVIEPSSGGGN
ncbi:hypothetical protein [Neorhizobium sp. JUb45]|uniref:hypothetical protein n=1 Tax=Neorhizobium sp. JUb45 TaxID=2485113 RepID=UPI00104FFDDD|nr:hypothetical protein [Neorhizobium sp. JUb45]TCR01058.1 putative tail protein [Neorhizobium sp. JUb45]